MREDEGTFAAEMLHPTECRNEIGMLVSMDSRNVSAQRFAQ